MGRHHILSFEELFPQISSFDMIFESTPHFFNFQGWTSQFWKQLIPFFRNKRCLTPCPHVALYPQLYHSHSFPVPLIGTLSLRQRVRPNISVKVRFFSIWCTHIRTALLLCLSKEQGFFIFYFFIILQKQRFSFLKKNRKIFSFCELAIKKESLRIYKLSISRATNHHSIGNKWIFAI